MLGLVDDAKSGIEVVGEGGESVEPCRVRQISGLVEVRFDKFEGRTTEVADGVVDFGALRRETGRSGPKVDPTVGKERSAFARASAIEVGWRRGFRFRVVTVESFRGRDGDVRSRYGSSGSWVGHDGGELLLEF